MLDYIRNKDVSKVQDLCRLAAELAGDLLTLTIKPGADTCQIFGGEAYCFDKMKSHFHIVLEQKTIVLQNIWGGRPLSIFVDGSKYKVRLTTFHLGNVNKPG